MSNNFPYVPEETLFKDEQSQFDKLSRTINKILQGRSNNVTIGTLTASTITTVFDANLVQSEQAPSALPMTANAGFEAGNGTMYISNVTEGQFTVTHGKNSQTDRTFRFVFWG